MTTQIAPSKYSTDLSRGSASHFFFHRDKIEQEIAKSILSLGERTKLRDACEYALTSGGNGTAL